MLKKALKTFVNLLGFELVKRPRTTPVSDGKTLIFSPVRNTVKEALQHLKALGFSPDAIVDVGAADGTVPILEVFPETYYYWIEPLQEFETALKVLQQKYKGEYHITAVGDSDGMVTFHVHPDWVGSSMMREADGPEADGVAREVPLAQIDNLIPDISGEVFLKVDVQGAELQVLDGAAKLLTHCEAVLLEVSMFKAQVTNPEFAEVIAYMKARGFVPYDILEGHNRPLDHALAQKDVLFVKENGRFRLSHRWATDAQRKEYAETYRKG